MGQLPKITGQKRCGNGVIEIFEISLFEKK
jgi:hypothetical protein